MELYKLKICLMGEPGVGKTSLIRRFVYGAFPESYLKTIGTNVYKKEIKKNGNRYVLMVWDIMGEESFRQILKTSYFFGSDALIAVADVTREDTLDAIKDWVNAAESVINKKVPIILLVNKADLEWKVKEEQVKKIADEIGAIEYMFTSAKRGDNVNEAFERIVEAKINE